MVTSVLRLYSGEVPLASRKDRKFGYLKKRGEKLKDGYTAKGPEYILVFTFGWWSLIWDSIDPGCFLTKGQTLSNRVPEVVWFCGLCPSGYKGLTPCPPETAIHSYKGTTAEAPTAPLESGETCKFDSHVMLALTCLMLWSVMLRNMSMRTKTPNLGQKLYLEPWDL